VAALVMLVVSARAWLRLQVADSTKGSTSCGWFAFAPPGTSAAPSHAWYMGRSMASQVPLVQMEALPLSYTQLSETTLDFDLDLKSLRESLVADIWTESTLPIFLLNRDGAAKIDVQGWKEGQTRTVSYKLLVLPGGIGARVENTYTVGVDFDDILSVEIVSVTYAPVIENMRVYTYYKLVKEGAEVKLQLGGFSEWTKAPPKLFAAPIEKAILKSQTASGKGFIEALKQQR